LSQQVLFFFLPQGIGEPMNVAETFTFTLDELNEEEEEEEIEDENEESDKKKEIEEEKENLEEKEEEMNEEKEMITLKDFARLDTMVTVIDAYNFLPNLKSLKTLKQKYKNKYTIEDEDDRTIIHLLMDQVEFANVIIINKIDLLKEEDVEKIKGMITILNPNAKIYTTNYSQIPLNSIINTKLFDFEEASTQQGNKINNRRMVKNPQR
jgi:G3E family GTPase